MCLNLVDSSDCGERENMRYRLLVRMRLINNELVRMRLTTNHFDGLVTSYFVLVAAKLQI